MSKSLYCSGIATDITGVKRLNFVTVLIDFILEFLRCKLCISSLIFTVFADCLTYLNNQTNFFRSWLCVCCLKVKGCTYTGATRYSPAGKKKTSMKSIFVFSLSCSTFHKFFFFCFFVPDWPCGDTLVLRRSHCRPL